MDNAKYIEVIAGVRYWEDATVNGVADDDGKLIPFRVGDCWRPVISLDDGQVQDWPEGMTASIHYKVCDCGEYWLLDAEKKRIAKYGDDYVPDKFLCHGSKGWGDYIILNVGADGKILNYRKPVIDESRWEEMDVLLVAINAARAV